MKITYAISLEDYRALHPEFTGRAGHNAGFKGVLVVCVLIAILGIFCMVQGIGIAVGCFLIGLGALAAAVAFLFDKRSVQQAKETYFKNISTSYLRVHCPDQRTVQVDENGFTVSCRCGTVTRPWPEVAQFSETAKLVLLGTKAGIQLVPKSAFHSEGEITEFRAFVLEKLNTTKPLTSRPIDFTYSRQDFLSAYFVHVLRGGGWRGLLTNLAAFIVSAYGVFVIWTYLSPVNALSPPKLGIMAGLLIIPFARMAKLRRKHYLGRWQVHFGEEGLHLQNANTVARNSWKQFIGYLEDDRFFLLYYSARNYMIIPKRALASQEAGFRALLKEKLQPYNYGMPAPVVLAKTD